MNSITGFLNSKGDEPMKIGIYGAHYEVHVGGMIRKALGAKNGQVVGLVEADDALYQKYSDDDHIERFDSLDELVGRGGAEVILGGVNHDEKADLVENCATLGVHVVLDKPLCVSRDHHHRIAKAVSNSRTKLSVDYSSRNRPVFMALHDVIREGELGELVSLITTHPHKLGSFAPDWYFDPQRYAGTFHDLACHGVDQIRHLTGQAFTSVSAVGSLIKHTQPPQRLQFDHIQASFTLAGGATALATADWLTPQTSPSFGDTRFIIMGTEGSAHLRAYADDHLLVVTNKKGRYEPSLPESRNALFFEDLIDAFKRDEEGRVSTADVLAVADACIAAESSAAEASLLTPIDGPYLTRHSRNRI